MFQNKVLLLVNNDNAEYLRNKYPQYEQVIYTPLAHKPYHISVLRDWLQRNHFQKFVNSLPCDCFFSASNIDYKITPKLNARKVVVIHDIKSIWEVSGFSRWRVKNYYESLVNNSDATIAISKYTRSHIIESISGVNASKIKVVYNSIKLADRSVEVEELRDVKYILYVNTLDVYKNIITLAMAYSRFPLHRMYKLIVVAKHNEYWDNVVMPIFNDSGIGDNVLLMSGIEDGVLKYLYETLSVFQT